ncbi:lanthionine synthetase C family protein [Bacillus atrophaeus]|uniref:lanthionine synthetase C family protein n=1 Tax=Bacillus atrophaeus TaxID=1452 RepID=UPI002281B693|nr:lanthionine synthetase C family protein [Bacillus atrophaeus]MCY8504112.1 lanthionine synthetase C family protein [Bacillus atrophaeus]MCY8949315.1 lanthionine synthetase C family protein [Bacillus atrophaeus]MCY8968109.1 lanthionine synthetase C family protein [Bacillus atrophaeus]
MQKCKSQDFLTDILLEIANSIKDKSEIEKIILGDQNNPEDIIQVVSLAAGYPGICVFLGYMDKVFPEDGWDVVAHDYLTDLISLIQTNITYSLSLFNGLAGVLVALETCSRGGTRYTTIINQVLTLILENYKHYLSEDLLKLKKEGVSASEYDVISGWTGVGRTLLHFDQISNKGDFSLKKALHDIAEYLLLVSSIDTLSNKPNWVISNENLPLDTEKKAYKKGYFNSGMAHGISGVLAFLSILKKENYKIKNLELGIKNIQNWLLEKLKTHKGIHYIPNVIENEVVRNETFFNHRDAWCYGTPGVSRAIFLSGIALNDQRVKVQALELFKTFFSRDEKDRKIISPTICHGYAGILMLTLRMYKDTNDRFLAEKKHDILNEMLTFYSQLSFSKFNNYELISGKIVEEKKVGLLEGSTGIALVLISFIFDQDSWDKVFLIS